MYLFGPAEQKGGKDLTPAIQVLEEKIRQMEPDAECLKR